MRFIACGTAGGPMTPQRASSGYLLRHDDHTIMLECGPGSLRNAMRHVSPADVEALLLSHLHLDHSLDLPAWGYLLRYNQHWPVPDVYGPPGAIEYVRHLTTFKAPNERACPFGSITELASGEEREVGPFCVTTVDTPHAENLTAHARRYEVGGRSLVFSGDTGPNEVIAALAEGADVLLHECYRQEVIERYAAERPGDSGQRVLRVFPTNHSELSFVLETARRAGVRRLVLTHLLGNEDADALYREASRGFAGEVLVAYDGMQFEF